MTLSKINNALLVVIIMVNGYVIGAPLVPALIFHWQAHHGKQQQLQMKVQQAASAATKASTPQPNHIIVPSMLLNQPIYDGPESQQYKILDQGIWRYAKGSSPDNGGNTVLIGHRFTYTNPKGVFYFLNKVKMGDQIALWWSNRSYVYSVTSISVVPPTDTVIEAPSEQPKLTLFTCTPLWLPKERLVVVASLGAKP